MAKILCTECGTILESKHQRDFKMCDCPNKTFIDSCGTRMGAIDPLKVQAVKDTEDNKDINK